MEDKNTLLDYILIPFIFIYFVGRFAFIAIPVVCSLAFNFALMTLPIWGGFLILAAIFS